MIDINNSLINLLTEQNVGADVSTNVQDVNLSQDASALDLEFGNILDDELASLLNLAKKNSQEYKSGLSDLSKAESEDLIQKINHQGKELELTRNNNAKIIEELMSKAEDKSAKGQVDLSKTEQAQTDVRPKLQPKLQLTEDILKLRSMLNAQKSINTQESQTKDVVMNGKVPVKNIKLPYKNEEQSILSPLMEMGESVASKVPSSLLNHQDEGAGADLDFSREGTESVLNLRPQVGPNDVQSANKVFQLNDLSTGDVNKIIAQIQDYIGQVQAQKGDNAQMTFKHPELGEIELLVQKTQGHQINVQITHRSEQAAKFFSHNQGELIQSLQNAGIQVAEFKLESNMSEQSKDFKDSHKHFSQNTRDNLEDTHKERQKNSDSERRRELWEMLTEKSEVAA